MSTHRHTLHIKTADFWTLEALCAFTGLKRRQIANLARQGAIPDATRGPDGLHFVYPKTERSLLWAKLQRKRVDRARNTRVYCKQPRGTFIITVPGLIQCFEWWRNLRERHDPLETWPTEKLTNLAEDLRVVEQIAQQVRGILEERSRSQASTKENTKRKKPA